MYVPGRKKGEREQAWLTNDWFMGKQYVFV